MGGYISAIATVFICIAIPVICNLSLKSTKEPSDDNSGKNSSN